MSTTARQRIVIAGKSPLSWLIAKELDKHLGEFAHFQIEYLTDNKKILADIHDFIANKSVSVINIAESLAHTRLRIAKVKSVNIRSKQIITTKGSINYDFLILDQLPYYNPDELLVIKSQLKQLLSALSARTNINSVAEIRVPGISAVGWQMALAIRHYQLKHFPKVTRQLLVSTESKDGTVNQFLKEHNLTPISARKNVGLTISVPQPYIASTLVKGAKLDKSNHLMTDKFFRLKGSGEVICFDGAILKQSNIMRSFNSLIGTVMKSFVGFLNGEELKVIDSPKHSLLLRGHAGKLLILSGIKSKTVRANLVALLEKKIHF